jgi:hypothetical protein
MRNPRRQPGWYRRSHRRGLSNSAPAGRANRLSTPPIGFGPTPTGSRCGLLRSLAFRPCHPRPEVGGTKKRCQTRAERVAQRGGFSRDAEIYGDARCAIDAMNSDAGEASRVGVGRITVSFRPAIPRQVAPQQSPVPLRRQRQCPPSIPAQSIPVNLSSFCVSPIGVQRTSSTGPVTLSTDS